MNWQTEKNRNQRTTTNWQSWGNGINFVFPKILIHSYSQMNWQTEKNRNQRTTTNWQSWGNGINFVFSKILIHSYSQMTWQTKINRNQRTTTNWQIWGNGTIFSISWNIGPQKTNEIGIKGPQPYPRIWLEEPGQNFTWRFWRKR